ncbi:hypothetical protein T10_8004 [Trichinella papuae]|uniref:Uncharacterized protein n=1 Tax=Trichinella papuae TaxID=268474 RepID=A0A0V1N3E6_9BILA|nr:hypothetical protein T10_8004 [Trichinella papuae]
MVAFYWRQHVGHLDFTSFHYPYHYLPSIFCGFLIIRFMSVEAIWLFTSNFKLCFFSKFVHEASEVLVEK